MEWRGDKFMRSIGTAATQANLAAAREYVNQVGDMLNRGGFGPFSPKASPSAPGSPPHKSTGALARSFFAHQHANGLSGMVSTRSPYAIIHEFGGTILPKGRFLVWPATLEGRRHLRKHVTIRNALADKALFMKKNRLGGLLVFTRVGKRNPRLMLLYVMKSVVTLPARPYIARTLRERTSDVAAVWVGTFRGRLVGGVLA